MPGEQRGKILIIDDDTRNIFALHAVLRTKGFECLTAGSAEEGLQRLADEDVSIVLLDMMMPDMDGYETIANIRSGPYAEVPVVSVTAQAMTGDRERSLEAGADEYISKPIDVDRLLDIIRKYTS